LREDPFTTNVDYYIDSHPVGNKSRPVAIGRKNYLVMYSHESAQRAVMFYSFFPSCKINNVVPEEWLSDLLLRINDTKAPQLSNLFPNRWVKSTPAEIKVLPSSVLDLLERRLTLIDLGDRP